MKKYFFPIVLLLGWGECPATVIEVDVFIETIYEDGISETDVASSQGIG